MITASMVNELRGKTGAGMMDCKKALTECNADMDAAVDWLREKGIAKAAKKADRIAAEGLANIFTEGNKAVILEVNCETDFVTKNAEFVEMIEKIGAAVLNSEAASLDEVNALEVEGQTVAEYVVAKTSKIGEKLSLRRAELVTKTDSQNFGSYLHMGGKIAVLIVVEGASTEVAKDVAMHACAMRPSYTKETDVPTEVLEHEKEVMKAQLLEEGKPADRIDGILVGKVKKYYEEVCLENQIFVKAENKETVKQFVEANGGSIVSMTRFEVGEGMEKRSENFAEEVAKQING